MGAFNPLLDEDSDGFEINPVPVALSSTGAQHCCTKKLNRPIIVAAGEDGFVQSNVTSSVSHKYCYDPVLLEFLSNPNFGTYDTSGPYADTGTDSERRLITDAPRNIFPDGYEMRFGEDLYFGENTNLPNGIRPPTMSCQDLIRTIPGSIREGIPPRPSRTCAPHWSPPVAGNDPKRDEKNMRRWIEDLRLTYSRNDSRGITAHAFNEMFGPINNPRSRNSIKYYTTRSLNAMLNVHENINGFCDAILNAPPRQNSRHRIHQALKAANWDINNIQRLTNHARNEGDFRLPALNKYQTTDFPFFGERPTGLRPSNPTGEDANNGLALLIHGFANVTVVATNYCYREQDNKYDIDLLYLFYDLFGIDTADVAEFNYGDIDAFKGLKSWYYLQRNRGYAPHITRNVVFRSFRGIDAT